MKHIFALPKGFEYKQDVLLAGLMFFRYPAPASLRDEGSRRGGRAACWVVWKRCPTAELNVYLTSEVNFELVGMLHNI